MANHMNESVHGLSVRGRDVGNDSTISEIWEILSNQYDQETNPDGYVSLGVAENYLMHDTLVEYINQNAKISSVTLTYGKGGVGSTELRAAIAHILNRHLQPVKPLEQEHVVATNGCSTAIEHLSWLLANPGEGILLGRPYYGTFISDLSLRPQAKVVPVEFGETDPVSAEGVMCYEKALEKAQSEGVKIKALMLCNPHNPLGRCYPRETIIALMRLCQKHQVHFISDEIYALSVWKNEIDQAPPPVKFVSALSVDPAGIIDPHLVHLIWGLSKDFGANGLRLGAVISQSNLTLTKGLITLSLYSYASGLTDAIVSKMLMDDEFTDKYIVENQRRLSTQYSKTVRFLKENGIEYAPGANAAFFLWMNLGKAYAEKHGGKLLDEQEIVERLLAKRVFLVNGNSYGSERPGWFRLVFTSAPPVLEEGLKRLVAAIQ